MHCALRQAGESVEEFVQAPRRQPPAPGRLEWLRGKHFPPPYCGLHEAATVRLPDSLRHHEDPVGLPSRIDSGLELRFLQPSKPDLRSQKRGHRVLTALRLALALWHPWIYGVLDRVRRGRDESWRPGALRPELSAFRKWRVRDRRQE